MFDGDFNVLGRERSKIEGFQDHRLFCRLRNPGLTTRGDFFSESRAGLGGGGRRRLFLLYSGGWVGAGLG